MPRIPRRRSYKTYLEPTPGENTIPRCTFWRKFIRGQECERGALPSAGGCHREVIPSDDPNSSHPRNGHTPGVEGADNVQVDDRDGAQNVSSEENLSNSGEWREEMDGGHVPREGSIDCTGSDASSGIDGEYDGDEGAYEDNESQNASIPGDIPSDCQEDTCGDDVNSGTADVDDPFAYFFRKSTVNLTSVLSANEIHLLALVFTVRHSLSYVAIADLLTLINTIFGKRVLPETKFLFKKLVDSITGQGIRHHFCNFCMSFVGGKLSVATPPGKCPGCQKSLPEKDTDFFMTLDVDKQLKNVLETLENPQIYRDSVTKENPLALEDISDGILYQKLTEPGNFLNSPNNYSYVFNTDGCPIFKSSKCSVWPIYIMVNELSPEDRSRNLLLCGVWVGSCEPKMDLFLQEFVKQAQSLYHHGVVWMRNNEKVCSKFICVCCCVDSVARPLVQCTTQFNGYYGCGWCYHSGDWFEGQVRYPVREEVVKERTAEGMERHMQEALVKKVIIKGVKGPSPLLNLPLFNIVQGFVPDYMHSVCLGVVRQITCMWCEDSGKDYYIGNPMTLAVINRRLIGIEPPKCISRLPRSLNERRYWKATEWKNWLLFYSLPCLEGVLPRKYLQHWVILAETIYLLLSKSILPEEINEAHVLLFEFVHRMEWLYGKSKMTFNVHLLLHLAPSVRDWGPLWAHSTFPFENANRHILQNVKGAKGVAQQISSRFLLFKSMSVQRLRDVDKNVVLYCESVLDYPLLKRSEKVTDCRLLGCGQPFVPNCNEVRILTDLGVNVTSLLEYSRVLKGSMVINSVKYTKSDRRNDRIISLRDGRIGEVLSICKDEENLFCFLIVKCFKILREPLVKDSSGASAKYFKRCDKKGSVAAVFMKDVMHKCILIDVIESSMVAEMANTYEID